MSLFQALILGLTQGLTEFLPISSSGHLLIVSRFFGWPVQSVAFDAALHLATLAAIVFALRAEVWSMVRAPARLGWPIVLASFPVLLVGFFWGDAIETKFRDPWLVAFALAAFGLLLWFADRLVRASAQSDVQKVGIRRAVQIGLVQMVALLPGVSRSGITITSGLFLGLSREAAARFSFLLGIPAIAAAGSYGLWQVLRGGLDVDPSALAAGMVAAFVSGFLAIRWLLKLLRAGNFTGFVVYRLLLAGVIIISLI
jgi:undecaprenyl-diphosphatase